MRPIAVAMSSVAWRSRVRSPLQARRGERRRVALEHREHRQLVLEEPGIRGRHLRADIGPVDDEALRLQAPDGLANGQGRYPELGGEAVDHDAITRPVRPAKDPLANRLVDTLLLRRAGRGLYPSHMRGYRI